MIPVLQNVKLEIYDGQFYATGDNSEIHCVNSIDIKSKETLAFCVNFQMLLSILKSIKNQDVDVSVSSKNMKLKHKNGEFDLPLDSVKEFPSMQSSEFKKKAVIDGASLKSSLKVANKFILNSDLEAMANISIEIAKRITIRSTNKQILFEDRIKGSGDEEMILLSGKSSTAIFPLIPDDEINVKYNRDKIFFKSERREIMVVQQNGDFPVAQFNNIMDSFKKAEHLEVDFGQLLTALRRVSILSAKEKTNSVRFDIGKKELELTCDNTMTHSKAHELLRARFSKNVLLGFNAKFLIEVLGVFDENAKFYINEANCFCLKSKKKKGLIAPVILAKDA
jgi:DNA polymerase-3 subunit beta